MPGAMRILLLCLVACASARPFQRADVEAVLTAQAAAWNRGDLDGYMAGYLRSENLVFTSGGHIRHGWQDAHDHYKARYGADKASMGQLAFEILQIDPVGEGGAVVLGRWKLTGPAAGSGVFTVVLARDASGWHIVHDHTSSD